MKKILTAILALAMAATMFVTSFAANPITEENGTDSKEVKATYITGDRTDVYSVKITWDGMEFEYVQANQTWDTVNHKWIDADGSSPVWRVKSDSGNYIVLCNNSSKDVNTTFSFQADPSFPGLDGDFRFAGDIVKQPFTLPCQDNTTLEANCSIKFTPTTPLPDNTTTQSVIGQITVTID